MIRDIENTHQVAAIFQMEDGDKTNVPNVMKNVKWRYWYTNWHSQRWIVARAVIVVQFVNWLNKSIGRSIFQLIMIMFDTNNYILLKNDCQITLPHMIRSVRKT